MSQQPLKLKVIGIPHIPSITQINARLDATTTTDIAFKIDVGTTDIPIIDVQADRQSNHLDGKVYQWFRAQFEQGMAWVRDDLVEIWGDGSTVGYPIISTPTVAHHLQRDTSTVPHGAETQAPTTESEVTQAPTTESEVTQAPTTESEVTQAPTTESEVTQASQEPPRAKAMSAFDAKMRPGPGTGHNPPVTAIPKGTTVDVLDTRMGDDGKALYWVQVRYSGQTGWVREDLLRLSGNFAPFGLNAPDKYPNPAPESTWSRGWDVDGSIWNTGKHDGWDHAGRKGAPLLAGPHGGVIFEKKLCAKCGNQGLSTLERGLQLYDTRVYTDQGWNFGYGHYLIVAYEHSTLPASTRAYLASQGRDGQHIFVMYAHCQDMLVESKQTLTPNQQIATLGNSGNSNGAHLHLEVRISASMNPQGWYSIKDGLRSPGILFLR
ncbi:MAG: peptidoglycan DD-metalloendopeptidase family protein [Anaerolineae bacterium]